MPLVIYLFLDAWEIVHLNHVSIPFSMLSLNKFHAKMSGKKGLGLLWTLKTIQTWGRCCMTMYDLPFSNEACHEKKIDFKIYNVEEKKFGQACVGIGPSGFLLFRGRGDQALPL